MKKRLLLIILSAFLLTSTFTLAEEKIKVTTSFYILYELVQEIAGNKADINIIVPNGAELHSYEPLPRDLAKLENADVFFYNGLDLEPWATKVITNLKNNQVRIVKLSEGLDIMKFTNKHSHDDDHDHHHHHCDHSHGPYDPHIWLNPLNMQKMAQVIKDEFIKLDPAKASFYQENYTNYAQEIQALDQDYKETLAQRKSDNIMVSHAAFGYLAQRYGLKQLAVTGIAPHSEPNMGTIAELINKAQEHKIEYIFMETLSSPKVVEIIAEEANLKILTLNPLEGLTAKEQKNGENYFSIMRKNLSNLRKALVD